jgi:hypothetical protein
LTFIVRGFACTELSANPASRAERLAAAHAVASSLSTGGTHG